MVFLSLEFNFTQPEFLTTTDQPHLVKVRWEVTYMMSVVQAGLVGPDLSLTENTLTPAETINSVSEQL